MGLLYGRAGRLTALLVVFGPCRAADEGNGAVRFFRGSHRLGLLHAEGGEEGTAVPKVRITARIARLGTAVV